MRLHEAEPGSFGGLLLDSSSSGDGSSGTISAAGRVWQALEATLWGGGSSSSGRRHHRRRQGSAAEQAAAAGGGGSDA
jgi:hypothetical protein